MGRKARLRPEQQELLSRYLDAYRAGRITGAGNAEPKL
jgi:hypothetical protein